MEIRCITDLHDLKPGAFGILEPNEGCRMIGPEDIDLAITPCLSCDRSCNRLGKGGGYYDRLLDANPHRFPAVSLCREELLLDEVPVEAWDYQVDAVVTEENIYRQYK